MDQLSRKLLSFLLLDGCFSFRSALASIWRMPLGSSRIKSEDRRPSAERSPRVNEKARYSAATRVSSPAAAMRSCSAIGSRSKPFGQASAPSSTNTRAKNAGFLSGRTIARSRAATPCTMKTFGWEK